MVLRGARNVTEISSKELELSKPQVKELLKADSPFMALFRDADEHNAKAWGLKHGEGTREGTEPSCYDVFRRSELKVELAKEKETQRTVYCPGEKGRNSDSVWCRDADEERARDKGLSTALDEENMELDAMMAEREG